MKATPAARQHKGHCFSCCKGKKLGYSFKVRLMVTVCVVLVLAAAALLYFLLNRLVISYQDSIFALPKKMEWTSSCPIQPPSVSEMFDCFPDDVNVSWIECEARGCCYLDNSTVDSGPRCVYPTNYGYVAAGKAKAAFNGFEVPLQRLPAPSRYGDDIHHVHMKVEMQTKYRLRIKFYDQESARYEVPSPKIPVHASSEHQDKKFREVFLYSITYSTVKAPFAIKVRRSSTDKVVFDTSAGALSLSNQFLEISTFLPSFNVYGLGKQQILTDFNWKKWSLLSSLSEFEYGSRGEIPMYLCIEDDGNAHGVLLLNSNAMEMELHPSPALTFRTIGGIFDFYLFLGPTPEDVIRQYNEAIGRPVMPPYWALGLHIGRSSYDSINDAEQFLYGFNSKYIPVESLIMGTEVFKALSLGSKMLRNFSSFTTSLRNRNQRLMLMIEPAIIKGKLSNRDSTYSLGMQQQVFMADKWGLQPIEGMRNGNVVVYPDFGSTAASQWWRDMINKLLSLLEFEGLWLIRNEPINDVDGSLNGCMNDDLNDPPYMPGNSDKKLYWQTLCMDTLQHWKDNVHNYYDLHNLYGHSMAVATDQALDSNHSKRRKLLLSDSTFVGTGRYAGRWLKKSFTPDWEGLRASIPAVLEMATFGVPFSGASIWEKNWTRAEEMDEELCLRWLQLAIFYPYIQIYSSGDYFCNMDHHSKEFFHAARNAISRRYEMLPYLYTLMYMAHVYGAPVIHPLFHEFPLDNETYSLNSQFMWGPSLLISPILEKGAKEISFYLPKGIWYEFYMGMPVTSSGEWFKENAGAILDSKQPASVYIRAGYVIPLQKPSNTTATSRQNPMSLLVALDESKEATGSLFWDDGETKDSHILGEYVLVEFAASNDTLIVNGKLGKKVFMSNFYTSFIQQVRIMGLPKPPKRIIIDSSYILSNKQYHWNYDTKVLNLKYILIPLARRTKLHWIF